MGRTVAPDEKCRTDGRSAQLSVRQDQGDEAGSALQAQAVLLAAFAPYLALWALLAFFVLVASGAGASSEETSR